MQRIQAVSLVSFIFFRGCVTPWQVARIKKDGENSFPSIFFVRIAELLQLESGKVGYGQCQFSA